MNLKLYIGLIGIITLLSVPEFVSKSASEWQQRYVNRDKHRYETHEVRENCKRNRGKKEINLAVVKDRLEERQTDFDEAEDFGIRAMNEFYDIEEPKLFEMGLFLNSDHPARYVAAFNRQSDEAKDISKIAYAALKGSKKLIEKYSNGSKRISLSDFERDISISWSHRRAGLRERCPRKDVPHCSAASLKYRTADGTCNNPDNPWWGSAMSTMQRFLPPMYENGVDAIRKSVKSGKALPSPRDVSVTIHEDKDVSLAAVTHMLMQWGQFIDHDVTATAQSRGFNDTFPQCCRAGGSDFQPPELMHPDCLPIVVNPKDNFLGPLGIRCLEFVRSGAAPREDCGFGPREQLIQVTSYIDASMIYSSNARHSDSLRISRGGLLQYGKLKAPKSAFSRAESDDICRRGSLAASCFRPGDARLTEQPALTSLHVAFLRAHNEIATELSRINRHWGDEKLFQESRKIVGALIQRITYREYLPIVLGPQVIKIFGLEPERSGYSNDYDPSVNSNIANSFSSAAYRFGHSMVGNRFLRYNSQHHLVSNNVSIHEELSNRMDLHSPGSVDRLLLGLVNQPAQRRDECITRELTNHLFQFPGFRFGMDLAAINIQRGRDHGLPPYVKWREPCGLTKISNWLDLERVMPPTVARKYRRLYESVEDIDLFTAGLAERSVRGGLVGPTFACIIAQQFSNLKKGDRFWYENGMQPNSFTLPQLHQIRGITLAHILCRVLENISTIQRFVFLTADILGNERISCNNITLNQWDFRAWIDREKDNEHIASSSTIPVGINMNRYINTTDKIFDQAKAFSMKKTKPIQTNLHQKNRIVVKRPVGSAQDNVTIVVHNHAVNSPIFVSDANYGSNFQSMLPNIPLSTPPSTSNSDKPIGGIYPSIEMYPSRPIHPTDLSHSYVPVSLQDPNNPNPYSHPITSATTGYSTNYQKSPSTHHNDAWVNIGPLLDQLRSDWHQSSNHPSTADYISRMRTSEKTEKINYQYELPQPLIQNNNGAKSVNKNDDNVIRITNNNPEVTKELLDMWSGSKTINNHENIKSDEIPRPIQLTTKGF